MNNDDSQYLLDYDRNIFINCPYDEKYLVLLKAMIFTIIYLGLEPKLACESSDCAVPRILKIKNLILWSKYGIHDISRVEYSADDPLPRFNMPFELGMDWGYKYFSSDTVSKKKLLVFDKEKYRYQRIISDISGDDIMSHENNPEKLVRELRNWLYENVLDIKISVVSPGSLVWDYYNLFLDHLQYEAKNEGYTDEEISNMPIKEYKEFCREWIISRQKESNDITERKNIRPRSTRFNYRYNYNFKNISGRNRAV